MFQLSSNSAALSRVLTDTSVTDITNTLYNTIVGGSLINYNPVIVDSNDMVVSYDETMWYIDNINNVVVFVNMPVLITPITITFAQYIGNYGVGTLQTGPTGPGLTGDMGSTGPTGPGLTGSTGHTGPTGPGLTGDTGYTGPTGPGLTGSTGYTGPTGPGLTGSTGHTGPTGPGLTGDTGPVGSTGITGSGLTGSTGPTGLGMTGPTGLGMTGPAGLGGFTNLVVYITGSGNFTVPTNITLLYVELLGGGGGGAGVYSSSQGGGGGGSGGYLEAYMTVTPGQIIAYSVGAGGKSSSSGSNTTFNTLIAEGGSNGTIYAQGNGGGVIGPYTFGISGFAAQNAGFGGIGEPGSQGANSPKGYGQGGLLIGAATGYTNVLNGNNAQGYGVGGGGASANSGTATIPGGAGTGGFIRISY